MAETAAHLANHVIRRLPLRQSVLSVPQRRRNHLARDPAVLNVALRIFLSAIERALRQHSPGASTVSRLRAVIFIHRFGALLNTHLLFHCSQAHVQPSLLSFRPCARQIAATRAEGKIHAAADPPPPRRCLSPNCP
ncbi:MAG: hypothetical protein AW08_01576 [Candidatus Accumulibacter adjunctus]|uniref:Uncharacterized protein n=1 Tax=Candidatus Accumulibacter adjunctus TaxID=1454001 RepID=A0A011MZI1_9PROT|nr:MAG: hypothetical protein AW08_01576 [Candidatus Accumulibacter adjunctus]